MKVTKVSPEDNTSGYGDEQENDDAESFVQMHLKILQMWERIIQITVIVRIHMTALMMEVSVTVQILEVIAQILVTVEQVIVILRTLGNKDSRQERTYSICFWN